MHFETLLGKQKSEPCLMMTLPSAPFLKGLKRLEDQCMIKRIEIISKTLGKWSTLKAQEKKRSLDASREQEQRAHGCTEWVISIQGRRNTHNLNIRQQKYRRLPRYLKHYLKKPLAREEQRHLKVVGQKKGGVGAGTLQDGR